MALAALAAPAAAQVPIIPPAADPGAIQQRQIEEERRRRMEEELRRKRIEKPVDTEGLPPAKPVTGDDVHFLVREIEFSPSEILTRQELDALAKPYRGRSVSLTELQELVAQVNALYRKKGVVTAQAILPPQDLTAGVVRIRLIEGRVGKISVEGNDTTNAGYVTARVRQEPGDLVDLPGLERDLKRFNRTHDAQVRAELKPGAEVGQTDVALRLTEPPRHDLRFFSDNTGSEQTGETRAGLAYRNRSLLGWRDDLLLTAVRAEGQTSYSISYGVPLGTLGTRLHVAYYDDETEIKNGPLATLNLSGEATAIVATLRHPLVIEDSYQVDAILGAKKRNTINRIDDVVLQDTDSRDVNLGVEAQRADASGYWLATLAAFDVRSTPLLTPSRSFLIWRGLLRRSQNVAKGYAAVGNLNWQYTSDDLLPSGEQFLIGGEGSVRGYPTGILAGDYGFTLNVELHHPLPVLESEGSGFQASGFFFADYGQVWPYRPAGDPRDDRESLWGAGWGINLALRKAVTLRVSLAVPLESRPEQPDNYRVTFQFAWSIL